MALLSWLREGTGIKIALKKALVSAVDGLVADSNELLLVWAVIKLIEASNGLVGGLDGLLFAQL